jgi:hypothetical protein
MEKIFALGLKINCKYQHKICYTIIEKLKKHIGTLANAEAAINIVEVRKPEIDAKLVAEGIAQQIERRVSFRRAMKRGMQTAFRMGALGIRVNASGLYVLRLRNYSDLQTFLDEVSAIADKNLILEMYSLATDQPFSFLTVKLTAKNKNDIFMIRFDKKRKFN